MDYHKVLIDFITIKSKSLKAINKCVNALEEVYKVLKSSTKSTNVQNLTKIIDEYRISDIESLIQEIGKESIESRTIPYEQSGKIFTTDASSLIKTANESIKTAIQQFKAEKINIEGLKGIVSGQRKIILDYIGSAQNLLKRFNSGKVSYGEQSPTNDPESPVNRLNRLFKDSTQKKHLLLKNRRKLA
jgi:hypothetical protein